MILETKPLGDAFGLEILDVDLAPADDAVFAAIRDLWRRDPLILLRRQSLTDRELLRFSRRFGRLDVNIGGHAPNEFNPELLYVSNLVRADGKPVGGLGSNELIWHTDQIYRDMPASGSIFYGAEMPEGVGRTSWCNMALAYAALPDELREQVDGRRAVCRYGTKRPLAQFMLPNAEKTFRRDAVSEVEIQKIEARTPAVIHDMVLENSSNGQRALYISPNHTEAIEGLDARDGQVLIDALLSHALRDDFIHTHEWRNGDVMLWDNARLLHRREEFDARLPRLAKRTTIYMDPEYFAVPEIEKRV
ncbi:MAG: TauD/TfdA family dioxygenase [Alphaproteobacteria bacterium]|nr:TauD/TfdA family dioxygenase [Alphaproteobacteria bacterium]